MRRFLVITFILALSGCAQPTPSNQSNLVTSSVARMDVKKKIHKKHHRIIKKKPIMGSPDGGETSDYLGTGVFQ